MANSNTTLVFGAAGTFAGLVVPALAARGARIRAFIRDEEAADAVRAAGAAEVAIGDMTVDSTVKAALRGADAVFYIAPAFIPREADVGVNIVREAQAAGVRRFVFSSVIHPTLSVLINHAAKGPVEGALYASNMEYAVLHPALFFQNFASGWQTVVRDRVLTQPWSTDTLFSYVDYRDVADVAAMALTEDRLTYGTFELCAAGAWSGANVAKLMGEVLGHEVTARRKRPPEGPGGGTPEPLRKMFDWYDCHGILGTSLTLATILKREPRTLRAYFEELQPEAKRA